MSSNYKFFAPLNRDSPLAQLQAVLSAAGSVTTGTYTAHSDQTMIFNLASAIAMNSVLTVNQEGSDLLLTDSAKLWLNGMSLMNPPAHNLPNLTNGGTLQAAAAYPLALLTASLNANVVPGPVRAEVPSSQVAAKQVPERVDRKRTMAVIGAESPRKRVNPLSSPTEVSPTDEESELARKIENRLTRILNEEIYNIFDAEEVTPEAPMNTSSEKDCKSSSNSSHLIAEMTLFDLIDYVSNEESPDRLRSVNSFFRKGSAQTDNCRNSSGSLAGPGNMDMSLSSPDNSTTTHTLSKTSGDDRLAPLSPGTSALIIKRTGEAQGTLHDDYFRCRSTQLEKTPAVWRGQIQLKTNVATVQLHFISGKRDFATNCLGPLAQLNSEEEKPKMRINQRMRTESQQLTNSKYGRSLVTTCQTV